MATLTGKITDVTHKPPESLSSITVKAPSARVGGGTDLIVSSPATVKFDRDTGDVTISGLTGGLSWLYLEGEGWSDSIALSAAEGMISLVEAIANASSAPGIIDYLRLLADFKIRLDDIAQGAVDEAMGEIASELTNKRDGNRILGTARIPVPAPVSETVTADIPPVTFEFEPVKWPALDSDGLIPESLLPQIDTEPVDMARIWAITDAVNPPPPMPNPDSLSAQVGARMPIPTHDGSGQAVHPSVHHFPAGVFGYEWWMAVTGYAGRSTVHEDPLLLASHTGLPGDWVAPDGVPFPIDDAGNPGESIGYNSDPDLVWDAVEGRMYVFWRRFRSSGDPVYTTLYVRSSSDGVTWTDAEVVMEVDHWQPATAPYFHVDELGKWTMHAVTTTTPGVLQVQYADDVLGPWSDPVDTDLAMPGGLRLWHCEVRKVGSWWLALAQDRTTAGNGGGELRVAVSRDGVTGWRVAKDSIVSRSSALHDWLYASSLVPYSDHGDWHWRLYYSAFTGSQSWLYYTEV